MGRGAGNLAAMGAAGYYLVTSTPLKSNAWQLRVVDIRKGEWRRPVASNMTQKRVDDKRFVCEFAVSELGDTLPEPWLDQEVRGLVRSLFALPLGPTALNVEAGILTHHVPWGGDGMTSVSAATGLSVSTSNFTFAPTEIVVAIGARIEGSNADGAAPGLACKGGAQGVDPILSGDLFSSLFDKPDAYD